MAFTTGTATNAADLYSRLLTFLTTDATLVGLNEQWTILRQDAFTADPTRHIVELRAPGSSGADQIHVQMARVIDTITSTNAIEFTASVGYDPLMGIQNWRAHPDPAVVITALENGTGTFMPIHDNSMDYWFVANGRRFICAVRSGIYWGSAYAGFVLTYGAPSTYPYPLFVGANGDFGFDLQSTNDNIDAAAFWFRLNNGSSTANQSGAIYLPSGVWNDVNEQTTDTDGVFSFPWKKQIEETLGFFGLTNLNLLPGQSEPLIPSHLVYTTGGFGGALYPIGRFDGVYGCRTNGIAAGDTINDGTADYLVVAPGTLNSYYAAIKLA